jgi:hypothetical protein
MDNEMTSRDLRGEFDGRSKRNSWDIWKELKGEFEKGLLMRLEVNSKRIHEEI